jgi:signal transduction histidine kinase
MDAHLKDRLAFLGSLASGLAHEIKNPLSTMTITLGLLREDFEEPETPRARGIRRKLLLLEAEVGRLEKILQDFLQFAGGHTVEPVLVDVNGFLGDLLDFFEPSCAETAIELRRQFGESLPQVLVDPELIKQALLNLLTNSRQAMPEGGDLMVRTSSHGDRVRIDVIDTGVGIPAHELERIFALYYSTKTTGTGLGLPTVRRIVMEHGGDVEASSEEGRGTCMSVFLPVPPTLVAHEPLRLPGAIDADGDDLTTLLAPPTGDDDTGEELP